MSEVYFKSNQEVISFCEFLFFNNKTIDVHWKTNEKWGNQLIVTKCTSDSHHEEFIAKAMVDVFIRYRQTKMIKEVITEKFYYSNSDEIDRILDITIGIMAEKYPYIKEGYKNSQYLLYSIFKSNLDELKIIHFDSIIKFRINDFREQLVYNVGLAIDEFKREEEHQAYVNSLREYIVHRRPIYSEIHLIQGKSFVFYKPNGQSFSKNELKKLMNKEPLYVVGLDSDEWNLAPLIAMAPQMIYIYGDDPSEPKTLTIINIFQERATFKRFSQFPFLPFTKKL